MLEYFHSQRDRISTTSLNRFGCSAAHWAVSSGNVVTCKWLFAHGYEFGTVNHAKHGVLATTVWKGYTDVVEWIIDDVTGPQLVWQLGLRELEGRSIVDIANLGRHTALAAWLQRKIDEYGVTIET